uniref:Dolichol phosphate-mannose biosynthesis regulatory protein n=1 Tax=Craspedostauros australis TaxID=1486917 RepID=A0A7R9ZRN9_9STRA|mmetsp:Transcript_7443/g.20143  ORF Transcript_7443/g.20143 Transcript_7443/m.20143 type:complete len:124 (+) Transcript_7443:133-504(+)|eukprot:CAMPEP_0198127470 /NCGR_PEP_ID=MMETSP1442-20131203/47224_1 /TAXON_ID= /ORGANISM="Craspedostauros australis, Strain CCMP3328" /LENGTH=123 /DNA_ID=CAMNT_0043787441 /DNA_START=87 /DNA_END=458 /DNA_ORIENTATION=-
MFPSSFMFVACCVAILSTGTVVEAFSPLLQQAAAAATTTVPSAVVTNVLQQQPSLMVAMEDYEVAELPPVWVPAVFALVLLVGVGLLTGSLGNVIDEESMLGLQSGARAKKEIERSRSSYFKK